MIKFKNPERFSFELEFEISEERWCYMQPTDLRRIIFDLGADIELPMGAFVFPYCRSEVPYIFVMNGDRSYHQEMKPKSQEAYEYVRGELLYPVRPVSRQSALIFEATWHILPELGATVAESSILQNACWKWGVAHPLWTALYEQRGLKFTKSFWIWEIMTQCCGFLKSEYTQQKQQEREV